MRLPHTAGSERVRVPQRVAADVADVALAAQRHAAPAAFVGLGAVIKPQHTVRVFAGANQLGIGIHQQVGGGFSDRRQKLFRRLLFVQALQA